jgi:hypothetical protein
MWQQCTGIWRRQLDLPSASVVCCNKFVALVRPNSRSDVEPVVVTRDEWLALPEACKAGIDQDAIRPISERDFACHVHYLLNGSKVEPESVEVATTAPGEAVIRVGHSDPAMAFAAAAVLEDEWDRDMLPIGLRLSFEPRIES